MTDSPVRIVVKALAILDCSLEALGNPGIGEIARQTSRGRPRAHP